MKRIDATIYFPECRVDTTVWVDDTATEDDVKSAIMQDAISMIDFDYHEH